jgi:hypothetical protein
MNQMKMATASLDHDGISDIVVRLPERDGIVSSMLAAKEGLISGLLSVATEKGWSDPTIEKAQFFWTSIEVLKSLVEAGVIPDTYTSMVASIAEQKKTEGDMVGWTYEGIPEHISVYVTGDVIRLYLVLCKFDEIGELLNSLQGIQNEDGGWGVCAGDKLSKVRSTSWVLSILFDCLSSEPTRNIVNLPTVKRGLDWLYNAQNDSEQDAGWSNMPQILPSNVSATALALDALIGALTVSLYQQSHDLAVRREAIRRGLGQLLEMNSDGIWNGVREEFAITVDARVVGRHIIGGAGGTFVLQVLVKAINSGLLSWPNDLLLHGTKKLIQRCRPYSNVEGLWLVPADDGGPPLTWNSAYALDAFNLLERFFAKSFADKWIEKAAFNYVTRPARFWRRLSLALILALAGIILAPYATDLGSITSWFASLPVLYQGLLLIVVTLAIDQAFRALTRLLANQW